MRVENNHADPAEAERDEGRRQAKIDAAMNMTPAQIDAYIDSNVTDLASARTFLKKLAKLVIFSG